MARTALGIVNFARGDGDMALAERLFENMRNRIRDGLWRYGEKLPGTRLLARDAGVSRWTAVVAVDMLIAEGLVEARKRSGTYVAWRGESRKDEQASNQTSSPRPNVPFEIATPALELFPMHVWRRLQGRRWRQMPSEALDDGDPEGWPALRQAIAEYAATTRGIQCTAEQVVVVSSVEAAGRLAAKALCRPGNFAWIENPGPPIARAVVTSSNLEPLPVALDREGLDVDEGCRLAPLASMAVVSPSVQFPTGIRMSNARRRRMMDWASSADSWILEVDHASEFPFGLPDSQPMAAMPGAKRVIYFDTFGKLLFPALRVAFLIVPREALERVHAAKHDFDRPPGVPNQIILADFLASGQLGKHLRRCREAYTQRRDALLYALSEECGGLLTVEEGQRGLHVCTRLPPGTDDVAVSKRLREVGVVAEPLSAFYANPTADCGLLLGFAAHRPEALRAGVQKLAGVLNAFHVVHSRAAAG
ncbi:MAG: PLP-dependent aminotransferase family protein [Alphaproteobacteria bacterium]|nr:PLP-dependent aminotransferase family protein [Alphaproteobacteria bacterium]